MENSIDREFCGIRLKPMKKLFNYDQKANPSISFCFEIRDRLNFPYKTAVNILENLIFLSLFNFHIKSRKKRIFRSPFEALRANKVKGRTAKIDIPLIKHSETTIHQHHFCQRDHGSISYQFSSRLIPIFFFRSRKKIKIVYKTLNSRPILLKIGMMIESGQENFLMS